MICILNDVNTNINHLSIERIRHTKNGTIVLEKFIVFILNNQKLVIRNLRMTLIPRISIYRYFSVSESFSIEKFV